MILSIIVPIFNAASTLERTLGSLELIDERRREEVQVICSDDGSSDGSLEIASRFADNFKAFDWIILESENGGVSAARNRALRVASGEWILFLDADDELATDPSGILSDTHDQVSMLCFPIERQFGGRRRSKRYSAPRICYAAIVDTLSAVVPMHICAGIFRRKLAPNPFLEELKHLEDWAFWWDNRQVFSNVKRVAYPGPLVIVHVHQSNRTSDFEATGVARSELARRLLEKETLSRKQVNNLRLQDQIGFLLQGKNVSLTNAFRFPCSPILWVKHLVYWAYGKRISDIHPYRRPGEMIDSDP